MTDLIQDAAAWLRDDPTFRTLARPAQEAEAADVLGQLGGDADDPLSVALAIEAALSAPAPASMGAAAGAGVEPCREDRAGCDAAVSATGRCMECGAVRAKEFINPPVSEPAFVPVVIPELDTRRHRHTAAWLGGEAAVLAPRPRVDTGGGLLYRVKAATGWPDRELAEALGISRATVQAYIGGRLVENLSADNLAKLAANLRQRQAALAAVLGDVEARL